MSSIFVSFRTVGSTEVINCNDRICKIHTTKPGYIAKDAATKTYICNTAGIYFHLCVKFIICVSIIPKTLHTKLKTLQMFNCSETIYTGHTARGQLDHQSDSGILANQTSFNPLHGRYAFLRILGEYGNTINF
jgi:hypothetical protein